MASLVGRSLSSYELIELAGQGGMAAVYRGFDRVRKMWVAVKVLAPALAEDRTFVRRFEREARILADLKHPSIVPILEFGQTEGYLFLVMPFYQEGSLARRMRHGPVLPLDGARIIESVSGALDHAHQMGVVHRDVKPSNVLLEGEAAHLADFGLAQIGDASISLTGSALLGTPAYVSPEAASGAEVGPPSDQYSLGVLIFELTVGKLPFDGDTPMAAIVKVLNDPFPRPRDINPKIPEAIERVILKATARNPAERFHSVGEMNLAFQAALQYALNPRLPAPPVVDVPSSARIPRPPAHGATQPLPAAAPRRKRRSWALLAPLLVLLAFACPLGASSMIELLRPFSNPAESSGVDATGIPESQITAAAATIQALSTEVAAAQGELAGPAAIDTAVALTLAVLNPLATPDSPVATETATVEGSATVSGIVAGTTVASSQTPTRTPSRTPTRTRTPTVTPTGSTTAFPSGTPVGSPSAAPSASASPTPSPTDLPPSSPSAAPTSTAIPPTSTPAAVDCGLVSLENWFVAGNDVLISVENNAPVPVKITAIDIDWPASNDILDKVKLRGNTIWDDGDGSPPTSINSNWKPPSRFIAPGATDILNFDFDSNAAPSGYSLQVTFNDICSVSSSH